MNSDCYLLDGSVLIALASPDHVHHPACVAWFQDVTAFATCPISEGALIRFFYREDKSPTPARAHALLKSIVDRPGHRFLAQTISYAEVSLARIQGHRQVTDAYLVALSQRHGVSFATLDQGVKALHPHVTLIPA